ncbi:MAG: SGNH/GDSL hydrolase family protein [Bacteroidota bacterium]
MKTFLKSLVAVAIGLLAAEILLAVFSFPTGVQLQETDLRTYDDVLVYRLRPNVILTGKRTPYFVHPEIRINSLGLRNGESVTPKPAGTFRILSLGDSYAFGWGVREDQCYARRLEASLTRSIGRRIEVINAGIPSYESWRELILLGRLRSTLDPDLVICQVADNDLGMNGAGRRFLPAWLPAWLMRTLKSSRVLTLVGTLWSEGLDGARVLRARAGGGDTTHPSEEETWDYMRRLAVENDSVFAREVPWTDVIIENYARMNHLARGSLICLLLPNRYQIYAPDYTDTALNRLATRLERHGIRTVNCWSSFRERNSEQLSLPDTHPNRAGHKLIADTLAAYLLQSGLLPH